ncbi:MAG: 2Fe-2S iron-sulfur cluster-binding protein [Pseudomonadota bacterium]
MLRVIVRTRNGEIETLEAEEGSTLMEVLAENDTDGIDAICGGALSCATCHVLVDPAWLTKVGGSATGDEAALLDGVDDLQETSRLSCQISISPLLDGLEISVPSE